MSTKPLISALGCEAVSVATGAVLVNVSVMLATAGGGEPFGPPTQVNV
jgi:hypothetical protein